MTVAINTLPHDLPDGATLAEALSLYSPFGSDPVIVLLNGRHADAANADAVLHDGDAITVFPRLIGG